MCIDTGDREIVCEAGGEQNSLKTMSSGGVVIFSVTHPDSLRQRYGYILLGVVM